MRLPRRLAVFVLLVATTALSAQTPAVRESYPLVPSAVEKELLKLEEDWEKANARNDVAFVEHGLADEFVGTYSDGTTVTKTGALANMKSAKTRTPAVLSDLRAHVYGDTGIVVGLSTTYVMADGKAIQVANRFTDVFVKRDGRWQCVASQSTEVMEETAALGSASDTWLGFPQYPGARQLCHQFVDGFSNGKPSGGEWMSFASREAAVKIAAFYSASATEDGSFEARQSNDRVLSIHPIAAYYPSCDEKPESGEKTVIVVAHFYRVR